MAEMIAVLHRLTDAQRDQIDRESADQKVSKASVMRSALDFYFGERFLPAAGLMTPSESRRERDIEADGDEVGK